LRVLSNGVLLFQLVETSRAVAETRKRTEKVARLAALLSGLGSNEVGLGVRYLSGELPQGKVGVGYRAVSDATAPPATEPSLTLLEVDARLTELTTLKGSGSSARRKDLLLGLLARATEHEQHFLKMLLVGELRQGALEGIMADAIAAAFRVSLQSVRRASMLHADLGVVAQAARERGEAGLAEFRLELFRPLSPMLAQSASSVEEAVSEASAPVILEQKLDGARVQVHKVEDQVRIYTRSLHEVSARVPEIVRVVRLIPAKSLILDGEALSLRPDGRPQPFQISMRRFGARLDTERLERELPLDAFFFDVLHADGRDLLDRPAVERYAELTSLLPATQRVKSLLTSSREQASAFLTESLADGHEGILVKAPGAAYEAGRRGAGWLKLKPAHTLDLVVLAAEWGGGRRRGFLSNLHLGARGREPGTFVMLGKTFKGMTDAMLAFQTEALQKLELGREGHVVHVKPELVVEVAFDGVQASREYPGGVALRFARVKRYRSDKTAAEADSIDTVKALCLVDAVGDAAV
jgi:DNA ligase-1